MKNIVLSSLVVLVSFVALGANPSKAESYYSETKLQTYGLSLEVFEKAISGVEKLKAQGMLKNDNIITIIDYTKPSSSKRLYIIDLEHKRLLLNTYVAHGRGSGELYAEKFSNIEQSYQSSLGFYLTHSNTYFGKHGLSLKLNGLEKGINDKALDRAIVFHGADYVNESFLKAYGRLGRSHGCPAVSNHENKKVIELIKGESVVFIYGNDQTYPKTSKLI